jgi:hypothetical protein
MKKIALGLAAFMVAAASYAQGTLNFSTFGGGVNAQVTYAGTGQPADGTFWGQLVAGPAGGALAPIGVPVPFRTGSGQGYITAGGVLNVPGVAGGASAEVKLQAWASSLGSSYAAALASGLGGVGESGPITITLGGAGTPPSLPAALTGLQGFSVATVVPEPSIAALGLLGAGLLLARRKK